VHAVQQLALAPTVVAEQRMEGGGVWLFKSLRRTLRLLPVFNPAVEPSWRAGDPLPLVRPAAAACLPRLADMAAVSTCVTCYGYLVTC
jgi:hypothetical protein